MDRRNSYLYLLSGDFPDTTSIEPAYRRSDEVEQRRGIHAKPYE